ncbi:threonine/homoserine efflux transporter RhtA [Pseudomonas marginalis]|nr:threonine/homoserine efflux transporter RhtA [Pseudomonas marginalis]MCP1524004.1 threonine/homoserine efflux transporter RhtA [Pseudomonas marginalis]MDQ0499417.1 threonine/homoserine efflux transporter RhtA [Pseudomonas marginalis]
MFRQKNFKYAPNVAPQVARDTRANEKWRLPQECSITILIIIGVVHTGLMSTLLYSAIQKIPTALVGALSNSQPMEVAM